MRAVVVSFVSLAVGAGILAFVLRGYGGEALRILGSDLSMPLLAAFLAAVAATLLVLSGRWGYVLAGIHRPLTLAKLVLYRSAAHSLAVLVPSGKLGGDPLRAWLAYGSQVRAGESIASVAVDRTLEIGSTAPFSILFATLLVQQGVPRLEPALVTVVMATLGLAAGAAIAVRRLRQGAGLVTSLMRGMRVDRLRFAGSSMEIAEASEQATADLVADARRMTWAFALGFVANVLVIVEFALLLRAFGLPSDAIAVVAAIFATGAAHMLPIPAGVGVVEGAQMWLFQMLGYPADVGLAVGLAVRLRELVWMLPGLVYLMGRWLHASYRGVRETP